MQSAPFSFLRYQLPEAPLSEKRTSVICTGGAGGTVDCMLTNPTVTVGATPIFLRG